MQCECDKVHLNKNQLDNGEKKFHYLAELTDMTLEGFCVLALRDVSKISVLSKLSKIELHLIFCVIYCFLSFWLAGLVVCYTS